MVALYETVTASVPNSTKLPEIEYLPYVSVIRKELRRLLLFCLLVTS